MSKCFQTFGKLWPVLYFWAHTECLSLVQVWWRQACLWEWLRGSILVWRMGMSRLEILLSTKKKLSLLMWETSLRTSSAIKIQTRAAFLYSLMGQKPNSVLWEVSDLNISHNLRWSVHEMCRFYMLLQHYFLTLFSSHTLCIDKSAYDGLEYMVMFCMSAMLLYIVMLHHQSCLAWMYCAYRSVFMHLCHIFIKQL